MHEPSRNGISACALGQVKVFLNLGPSALGRGKPSPALGRMRKFNRAEALWPIVPNYSDDRNPSGNILSKQNLKWKLMLPMISFKDQGRRFSTESGFIHSKGGYEFTQLCT